MTAQTPGQAAYEAWALPGESVWDEFDAVDREFWESIAQRGIDAFLSGDSVSAESIRAALAVAETEKDDLNATLDKLKPYLDEATRLLIEPPRFGTATRAAEIRAETGLPIIDRHSTESQ